MLTPWHQRVWRSLCNMLWPQIDNIAPELVCSQHMHQAVGHAEICSSTPWPLAVCSLPSCHGLLVRLIRHCAPNVAVCRWRR